MYKLAGSASYRIKREFYSQLRHALRASVLLKHLVSFGVSKNGYDIQKQHNKQVRDWFERHHYEVVVVQHKQRVRN